MKTRLIKSLGALIVFAVLVFSAAPTNAQKKGRPSQRELRWQMVDRAIVRNGITDQRVVRSVRQTPRHEFMPRSVQRYAHLDQGVPIGEGQTISSPFIVAYMTQTLRPQATDRVLEIGTGSGYQAAILSPLVQDVYTIEIVEPLGKRAEATLKRLGYENVHVKIGDGFLGWEEHAPYDKIIVTCSPEKVPQPLIDQLAEGGLLVVPVGERHQQTLYLLRKTNGELVREALRPTLFVPMTGEAEDRRAVMPDPKNPALINGDFETDSDENGFIPGWYYQRQHRLVDDSEAPSGRRVVRFTNSTGGMVAHLVQGFAIDGNSVDRLHFSLKAKSTNVVDGPTRSDRAVATVWFFDENREIVGRLKVGPFRGTKDWKPYRRVIGVPDSATEGIVCIGLFGATGTLEIDDVAIRKD